MLMVITITDSGLLRLMQLTSPSLPVGGFSFSMGLEYAIEAGWVKNRGAVEQWLELQLNVSLASLDLPIILSLDQNSSPQDILAFNSLSIACRESKELRLTELAMGDALRRLLDSLDVPHPFKPKDECSFTVLFALAGCYWQIEKQSCALGFAWSWLENQVAAATKLVPLGQTQAQQLLGRMQKKIPEALTAAAELPEALWGQSLPGMAMASGLHEQQYSRLFRS